MTIAPLEIPEARPKPPRAIGTGMVSTKPRDGKTVIDGLRQQGSLKLVFPRSTSAALDAVLVNTAGGVTGGDRFDFTALAQTATALTLTTQAAERAYRAQPSQTGKITNTLTVQSDATLHWLPQETIVFQGASLHRATQIDLAPTARLLFCEPLVFGRTAMGETITDAHLSDRVQITRAGQPLFIDAITLHGDIAAQLANPAVANGAAAMASIILIAPDASAHLGPVRAMTDATGGASLIGDDLLFIRLLATDSFTLRRTLIPILTRLHGAPLPRTWML